MKTLTLKQRTSYTLPQTDRSAVAATAITLKHPLSTEDRLRAEVARLRAELAASQAAAAQAQAQAVDRAQREVDNRAAWRAKMGLNRHTVAITVTGSTIALTDRTR